MTTRQKFQRGVPPLNPLLKSQAIEQVSERRHMGVIIDYQLKWQAYTNTVAKNVYLLSLLTHFSNVETCRIYFHAQIMSRINYVSNVWDSCGDVHIRKLISVQKLAVKVAHHCYTLVQLVFYNYVRPLSCLTSAT